MATEEAAPSADSIGEAETDALREQLKLRLSEQDAHQHIWELTVQVVQLQNARRQAEARLSKALEQVEHLKERRGEGSRRDGPSAAEMTLRRDLERVTNGLRETQRALTEARERAEAAERQLAQEQENRRLMELELTNTRERLDAATKVLRDLESAYLEGRQRS
jgi:uncharacterized coiled-coil DUF342 family protein